MFVLYKYQLINLSKTVPAGRRRVLFKKTVNISKIKWGLVPVACAELADTFCRMGDHIIITNGLSPTDVPEKFKGMSAACQG